MSESIGDDRAWDFHQVKWEDRFFILGFHGGRLAGVWQELVREGEHRTNELFWIERTVEWWGQFVAYVQNLGLTDAYGVSIHWWMRVLKFSHCVGQKGFSNEEMRDIRYACEKAGGLGLTLEELALLRRIWDALRSIDEDMVHDGFDRWRRRYGLAIVERLGE